MELMEAIKTCLEARVVVQTYASLPDEVYMETVLQLVMTEKDGVIFKAYAWTSELKERK